MPNPPTYHWHHHHKNYPTGRSFGELLEWHLLIWGTNPHCTKERRGVRWTLWRFAAKVHGKKTDDIRESDVGNEKDYLTEWRQGVRHPSNSVVIKNIFSELFGESKIISDWRNDLEASLSLLPEPCPIHPPKLETSKAARDRKGAPDVEHRSNLVANIPPLGRFFTGRAGDVDNIIALLPTKPSTIGILIQGGAGLGKTELTKAFAHDRRVVDRFGERRWFVELENARSVVHAEDSIGSALGFFSNQRFDDVMDVLNADESLLILDNLETIWTSEVERPAIEAFFDKLAGIKNLYLVGSVRGRIHPGDIWLPLRLETLTKAYSEELFSSIAGKWVVDDLYLPQFIKQLGGIPLAIDLVARRARIHTSLAPLWREWKINGTDFAKRVGLSPARLTSLSRSIEFSIKSEALCVNPMAQRLLAFLGRLPAGLCAEDRDQLISERAYDSEECLLVLGLAVPGRELNADSRIRIDLLPPIRDFVIRHCPLTGDEAHQLSSYFLDKAERLWRNSSKDDRQDLLDELKIEYPNFASSLFVAIQNRQKDLAINYLVCMNELANLVYGDSRPFECLVELCGSLGDDKDEALSLSALSSVQINLNRLELAYETLQREEIIYRRRQQNDKIFLTLLSKFNISLEVDIEKSEGYLHEMGNIFIDADISNFIRMVYYICRGSYMYKTEVFDKAIIEINRSIEISAFVGDQKKGMLGHSLIMKSKIEIALGDIHQSKLSAESARKTSLEEGDLIGNSYAMLQLGSIAIKEGDLRKANFYYNAVKEYALRIGDKVLEAQALWGIGGVDFFNATSAEKPDFEPFGESLKSAMMAEASGARASNPFRSFQRFAKIIGAKVSVDEN